MRSHTFLALAVFAVASAGLATGSPDLPQVSDPPPAGPLEVQQGPYIPVPPEARRTSPAFRWDYDRYVSVQVNVDANGNNILGDAANEPSIAIDPTNRQRIVIGWRQFDTISSDFRQAGWAYSHNGGQTWTFPGVIQPGHFRSDPVLDSDANGNFYYDSLTNEGGYNCSVFKSVDGGATWNNGVAANGGDKQWMTIDKSGSVGNNFIYSFWTVYYSACNGQFTRSTNGAQSFENCTNMTGQPNWGSMDVGPDGELYVAGDGFKVCKSLNAKISGQTPTWTRVNVNLGGSIIYGEGPNPDGLLGQGWVAVDRSNNPTRGYVYLLSSVQAGTNPIDIRFSRSVNGGTTWSPPVTINTDGNNGAWHWFGTMSVAPNGRIDVIWNDTRNHPGTYLSQVFYSYSETGGLIWSPNIALTPAFDPHLGFPQQQKIGDYYQMISYNAGAHLAYSATFNNEEDVYYLYIPRYAKGDVNCDGVVNFDDINPFVTALSNPGGYAAAYPSCDIVLADVNNDGAVNFDDINPFVALLSGD